MKARARCRRSDPPRAGRGWGTAGSEQVTALGGPALPSQGPCVSALIAQVAFVHPSVWWGPWGWELGGLSQTLLLGRETEAGQEPGAWLVGWLPWVWPASAFPRDSSQRDEVLPMSLRSLLSLLLLPCPWLSPGPMPGLALRSRLGKVGWTQFRTDRATKTSPTSLERQS